MSDFLPDRQTDSGLSPIRRSQLARHQQRAEMEVYRHELRRWVDAEKDVLDTNAAHMAVEYALQAECQFLDLGMHLADGSETKQQLLASKLTLFAANNNRRIMRRFGR